MSNTPQNNSGKDVLYIDVDDEITTIIDKVRSSGQRIVALVLPKRASMMQSIVNMRLLKRSADEAKKHIVLITSESTLLPLAGTVGLHVAKSLQSKPEIPDAGAPAPHHDDEDDSFTMAQEGPLDRKRPVGEYAGAAATNSVVPPAQPKGMEEETIDLDNTAPIAAGPAMAAAGRASAKAAKKDRKLKIPDFNRFRLLLTVGIAALVLLITGWYVGFKVMPKASVSIKTDSSAIDTMLDVTFDTAAKELDLEETLAPATLQQVQKTQSQEVPATGQKDKGAKATGTMKFFNCNQFDTLSGNDRTIPAGTGVSANGLTYITTEAAVVPPSNFNGNTCKKNKSSNTVQVTAQAAGEKYNVEPATYSVAGFSSVSGEGSAMAGGTSEIVKVISQADIDSAKQKISSEDATATKLELQKGLVDKGLFALIDTFTAVAGAQATPNAPVGTESETVTVTQKTTYTMLGAKQDHLKRLITQEVNKRIDEDKQSILDYGLDDAAFKIQNQQNSETLVSMEATAVAGSDLNVEEIKKQVAGKKSNDAKEIVEAYPGVTEVTVEYSPFWVSAIPGNTGKITVTVEKPKVKDAE